LSIGQWSTFREGDKIAPIIRCGVPTMVLDDGEALIESSAILDCLDELVGPERAMIAAQGAARRDRRGVLRISATSLRGANATKKSSILVWSMHGVRPRERASWPAGRGR
jgi:glutathione S-transferase